VLGRLRRMIPLQNHFLIGTVTHLGV